MKSVQNDIKAPITDTKLSPNVYSIIDLAPPKRKKDFESLTQWQISILETYVSNANISIGASADSVGINAKDVAMSLQIDKNFRFAYNLCRKIKDRIELMNLEEISHSQAQEPKATVERIFRLKSLNRERYADRGKVQSANVDININFGSGVSTYGTRIDTTAVKDGEVTDTKPTTTAKHTSGMTDIVSKMKWFLTSLAPLAPLSKLTPLALMGGYATTPSPPRAYTDLGKNFSQKGFSNEWQPI